MPKFYEKMIVPSPRGSHYCSCGKNFYDCEFWNSIKVKTLEYTSSELIKHNFTKFQFYRSWRLNHFARKICIWYVLKNQTNKIPSFLKHKLLELLHANATLINSTLELSGKSHFLDGSKDIKGMIFLDCLDLYDVYVIRLVRDGRGQVCSSAVIRNWFPTVEKASHSWVRIIKQQEILLEQWGGIKLLIRYEDLCNDTERVLNKIFNFCNMDPELWKLDSIDSEIHIMGNEMRLDTLVEISDRQLWQQKLSDGQINAFERIAGEVNRSYGYV